MPLIDLELPAGNSVEINCIILWLPGGLGQIRGVSSAAGRPDGQSRSVALMCTQLTCESGQRTKTMQD